MHISRFMKKKGKTWVLFTRAASGGLITHREVLFTSSCFYITLRAMFISSLGVHFILNWILYLVACVPPF